MQVYVSFCLQDAELVKTLINKLDALDDSIQWEPGTLEGSVRWLQVFENIDLSDIFLFILTPNTLISYSRMLEYNYALSRNTPIIPVQLDEFDVSHLPAGIPQYFAFDPHDPFAANTLAELAEAIATQPNSAMRLSLLPSDIQEALSLELIDLADQLRQRVLTAEQSAEEKYAIRLNLQELLERTETYEVGKSLLKIFETTIAPSRQISYQARSTYSQVSTTKRLKRKRQRGLAIVAVVASFPVIIAVGAFLIVSGSIPRAMSGDVTAEASPMLLNTSPSSAAPQVIDSTQTSLSSLSEPTNFTLTANSGTAVVMDVTDSPTLVPFTSTPLPLATETSPPSPSPFISPTSLPTLTLPPISTVPPTLPPTYTWTASLIPTETLLPTSTPTLPPTSTVPPTLPPTFTPTQTLLPSMTSTPSATFTSPPPATLPPTFTQTSTSLPSSTPTLTHTASQQPTSPPTFTSTSAPTATVDIAEMVPKGTYVGITVADTPEGVLVVGSGENAAAEGVASGDYVLAVDLNEVASAQAFYAEMNSRSTFSRVNLRLRRGDGIVFVILNLGIRDYTLPNSNSTN